MFEQLNFMVQGHVPVNGSNEVDLDAVSNMYKIFT